MGFLCTNSINISKFKLLKNLSKARRYEQAAGLVKSLARTRGETIIQSDVVDSHNLLHGGHFTWAVWFVSDKLLGASIEIGLKRLSWFLLKKRHHLRWAIFRTRSWDPPESKGPALSKIIGKNHMYVTFALFKLIL